MRNHPRPLSPRDDYVPESFEGKKIGVLLCALVHESGRHVARKAARSISSFSPLSLSVPLFFSLSLFVLKFTDGSCNESNSGITPWCNLRYTSRNLYSLLRAFSFCFLRDRSFLPFSPPSPPPRPKMPIEKKEKRKKKKKKDKRVPNREKKERETK